MMSNRPTVRKTPTTAPQTRAVPPRTRPTIAARVTSTPILPTSRERSIDPNIAPSSPMPADVTANSPSLVR